MTLLQALPLLVDRRWLEADVVDALAQLSRAFHNAADTLKLRRRVLRAQGFPPHRRIHYWKLCANVQQLVNEVVGDGSPLQWYKQAIGIENLSDAVTLASTGVEGEIARDVERTFPALEFFCDGQDGRRQLANALKCTAAQAKDVAYCQGMNYIAAVLLLLLNGDDSPGERESACPDETAFWIILSRCIYLYNQLLQIHFNDLYQHLRRIGMHPSFLATQWFVTLFARVLPAPSVYRIWDLFWVDGWKMVFRVALAITAFLRPRLLEMDMEQCSDFFRQNPKLGLDSVPIEELVARALAFKITRNALAKMESERHTEYLRLRLQQTPLSFEHSVLFPTLEGSDADPAPTLDVIRRQLQHFDTDVAGDTVVLRHKIEDIDKALAAATATLLEANYALTDVTFQLEDLLDTDQRLRAKYHALSAVAVAEATSPSLNVSAGSRSSLLPLWSPGAAIGYLNSRLFSCFERATRLSLLTSRSASQSRGVDAFDPEREEEDRKLSHLAALVPHHAADLKLLQRATDANKRELESVRAKYVALQQRRQLAQVALEEAQQFKDRLSDQMLQLLLATERRKTSKMRQLFAQVDGGSGDGGGGDDGGAA
ncbi:hypothetical protein PybrP1_004201 [[Pythium] brassicae (nom. inval.)]|nr:hypothetical protein PybrP1_004201 [[Pythium] brassicae (nom. inval.)]